MPLMALDICPAGSDRTYSGSPSSGGTASDGFGARVSVLNTASAELTAVATPEWLELFDPQTSRVVYANTVTGQCSWTRPDSS
ncbi:hypothetical protein GGI04_005796, partial [Coemansia thaxteri]